MARTPRWLQQAAARARRTTRWQRIVAAAVAVAVIAALVAIPAASSPPRAVATSDRFLTVTDGPRDEQQVRLDTTLYVPSGVDSAHPAPAVLLAHGFGSTKTSVAGGARDLARRGYVVLAWTARGFGRSGGQIALDSPDYEVKDARGLISWLGEQREVQQDGADDPRVGIVGASYGGALAIMTAAYDHRVDAIVPMITWNDLSRAFFPDNVTRGGTTTPAALAPISDDGVFKRDWAGLFFSSGLRAGSDAAAAASGAGNLADPPAAACGRFTRAICAVYQQVAQTGRATPQAIALLRRSSPAPVIGRVRAPTLLVQGETDTLFPLTEADANARGIAANGTPVQVAWYAGGHDGGSDLAETGRQRALTAGWLDHWLRHRGPRPTDFSWSQVLPVTGSDSGAPRTRTYTAARYPGLAGNKPVQRRTVPVQQQPQVLANPPGGSPGALSTVPGLSALSSLSGGLAADIPGETARFDSGPLRRSVDVVGAPQLTVQVTSSSTQAVLFGKVYDVAGSGSGTLPQGIAAPVRVTGLTPGRPATVRIVLPAIVHSFAAGHRMRVALASTDRAYATPAAAAVYLVSSQGSTGLSVPEVPGRVVGGPGGATPYFLAALALLVVAALLVAALALRRRRRRRSPDLDLIEVPLLVSGLRKAYSDGFVAVDGVTFRVEQGQVLGLLGPNGAGKTTTLRALMGLVRPTDGQIHVFGELVVPGAPVLDRVGAFVEGPGQLPHVSGLDNLRLYWAATGRPAAESRLAEALQIAGLGDAVHRLVRTYSHGMRQRLAIAQAMLGQPDLLVLDEPTNGLDPPQIRQMRDVIRRYAEAGRTVVVSSHVLAEVEQTCSHVVVMNRGMLVAAGTVEQIIGQGGALSATVDDAEAAVRVLGALPGVLAVECDGEHELAITLAAGTGGADVAAALVRSGVQLDRLAPRRRLEDAFLALVGDSS